MDKNSSAPVHCWDVWVKAFQAASKYLYARIEETGLCDTDYRILETLLHRGPLRMNTIGARVNLTPGAISTSVDRLFEQGLVSRVEIPKDRRVRVVSLTSRGKELITPVFYKHSAEIRKVFADETLSLLIYAELVSERQLRDSVPFWSRGLRRAYQSFSVSFQDFALLFGSHQQRLF